MFDENKDEDASYVKVRVSKDTRDWTPNHMVTEPGDYLVSDEYCNGKIIGYYVDATVYERKGILRLKISGDDRDWPVKGLHGWLFLRAFLKA